MNHLLEIDPKGLSVIAGPCSIQTEHVDQLYQLADLTVPGLDGHKHQAIHSARVVGLKSRTALDISGKGMGMDYPVLYEAMIKGHSENVPPSVLIAEQFVKDTNLGVAAEIMMPDIQMPYYVGRIPKGKFMPWQPSVEQLGWPVMAIAKYARENDWTVGIKNGKWSNKMLEDMLTNAECVTSMEVAWEGVATYASEMGAEVAFIHRGIDVPGKGEYRNAPVHKMVERLARSKPESSRFFDPSHTFGPNLRDQIPQATIDAMAMIVDGQFLYNGILIEAGDSITDTKQHVTIPELGNVLAEIAKFRRINPPSIVR